MHVICKSCKEVSQKVKESSVQTSSTQMAGISTVVRFSVMVMRLMLFKNMLNCTLFPPRSGVPVNCAIIIGINEYHVVSGYSSFKDYRLHIHKSLVLLGVGLETAYHLAILVGGA